jgi:hypothetical protein
MPRTRSSLSKVSSVSTAICVFLLLCAQFGALSHSLWHLGKQADSRADAVARLGVQYAADSARHKQLPAGQSELCAFDLAFGQVLGGVHGAGAPAPLLVLAQDLIAPSLNPRFTSEAPTAHSRGPPALS